MALQLGILLEEKFFEMLGRGKIILLMEQVLDTLTFFFLHDLWMRLALKDIFLLLRFLIQIPNIIEAFINAHCIFIILVWTHSHEKNSKNFVKMLYPLSKNISKILSTIYIGIRFCNSFHKNSTKKNICATIVGNGETVREVDGDGITT